MTGTAPPPSSPSASPPAVRPGWRRAGAVALAAGVGLAGAVVVADRAVADRDEQPTPTPTARPVPVLASGPPGSSLSAAVSAYAVAAFSDPTRGLVLGGWGAAFSDLFDDDVPSGGGSLVEDPRLQEPGGEPGFSDPCADEPDGPGCPDPDVAVPGSVLGDSPLGPNAALVYAFPHHDADLADECAFADVAADELPIAVITANPGDVEVTIGDEAVTITSDEQEVAEFDDWRASEALERPDVSFVAHCLAVPLPPPTGPTEIRVVAVDAEGQVATAATTLLPVGDRLPPTITPIDATMVRVDIPLRDADDDVTVRTAPFTGTPEVAPSCAALPPIVAPPGWRSGTSVDAGDPLVEGERPYLESHPVVRRVTVAMPEGEASLLCLLGAGLAEPVGVLVTPPDARRLLLAVTEVDAADTLAAGDVAVEGTFIELGWTPCGAALPAAPAGTSTPGTDGILCTSGGDTGAIAAAGGVLDVVVHHGAAAHRVRVALSASPGGPALEAYRLPIPAPDLEGTLCTAGAELPGCVDPEGDAVAGSLLLAAAWDEGPIGPPDWAIASIPATPVEAAGP